MSRWTRACRAVLLCLCAVLSCALGETPTEESGTLRMSPRMLRWFGRRGVSFPRGAIAGVVRTGFFVVRNTVPNLEMIARAWEETHDVPSVVEFSAATFQVPARQAADWGLDGWPATRPQSTPIGRSLSGHLSAAEFATLTAALRRSPGVRILATARSWSQSGNTALFRNVVESKLPGSDEPTELGISLMFTPTVAADGEHIDLELEHSLAAARAAGGPAERRRAQGGDTDSGVRSEFEAKVILRDGESRLVCCGIPGGPIWAERFGRDALAVFVTARIVKVPAPRDRVVVLE